MHGTFERPVAINGKVEIRPMMYIALTYDHRLVDGREVSIRLLFVIIRYNAIFKNLRCLSESIF